MPIIITIINYNNNNHNNHNNSTSTSSSTSTSTSLVGPPKRKRLFQNALLYLKRPKRQNAKRRINSLL